MDEDHENGAEPCCHRFNAGKFASYVIACFYLLKCAAAVPVILYCIDDTRFVLPMIEGDIEVQAGPIAFFIFYFIVLFVGLTLTILFIVGLHQNNRAFVKAFIVFSTIELAYEAFWVCFEAGFSPQLVMIVLCQMLLLMRIRRYYVTMADVRVSTLNASQSLDSLIHQYDSSVTIDKENENTFIGDFHSDKFRLKPSAI